MFKGIASLFNKKETVPENDVARHNEALSELKLLAPIMNALNTNKFDNSDFVFYLRLKSYFIKGFERYKDLAKSAELLRISIQAKDSFLKIEQGELRYRSSNQQEYYQFVFQLLEQYFSSENQTTLNDNILKVDKPVIKYSAEDFKGAINKKLEEILPKIKSEQGKKALRDYTSSLEILAAEKELGLKLLYIFKKFELNDFSVIKSVSEMVTSLQDKNLKTLKVVSEVVAKNKETFEKVSKVIGLSRQQSDEQTYAILLQYIALSKRHESYYAQFSRMMEVLAEWVKFYNVVENIRREFPPQKFDIPDEFSKEIPGLNILQKYQGYLL